MLSLRTHVALDKNISRRRQLAIKLALPRRTQHLSIAENGGLKQILL
jgi:hypothetical protein